MSLKTTVSFPLLTMYVCYYATPNSRNMLTEGVRAVVMVLTNTSWTKHVAAAAHQLRWAIARAK